MELQNVDGERKCARNFNAEIDENRAKENINALASTLKGMITTPLPCQNIGGGVLSPGTYAYELVCNDKTKQSIT